MTQENGSAELGKGQSEAASVVLRGACLMKDAGDELLISARVVCLQEGLQASHGCHQDRLLGVLHVLFNKFLNKGMFTWKAVTSSGVRGTWQIEKHSSSLQT